MDQNIEVKTKSGEVLKVLDVDMNYSTKKTQVIVEDVMTPDERMERESKDKLIHEATDTLVNTLIELFEQYYGDTGKVVKTVEGIVNEVHPVGIDGAGNLVVSAIRIVSGDE